PVTRAEVAPTAAILIGATLVSIPLGLVDKVRLAYQEAYISSVVAISVGVAGVAALLVAIGLRLPLPGLAALIAVPPIVGLLINGAELFRRRRPWLRPRLALAQRTVAWRLARLGFLFFVLQLAVAIAYQADVVIAAIVLGPTAAATYSVTLKFFF